MASPFLPTPPARLRIETARLSRDVIAPAFLAVYPNPANPARLELIEQHQTPEQLVSLTVAVIQWATTAGLMNAVMHALMSSPADLTNETPPPGPIPPDDLPPHLRGRNHG